MIVKTCLPRFINTFIETAADYRERIHIQSDLEDAGFELGQLKRLVSKFGNQSELLQQELAIWDRSYIEVCACLPCGPGEKDERSGKKIVRT